MKAAVATLLGVNALLVACATGSGSQVQRATEAAIAQAQLPADVPVIGAAHCVRQTIRRHGADPSRLTVGVYSIGNSAVGRVEAGGGNTPQTDFTVVVASELVDMGFSPSMEASRVAAQKETGAYLINGVLTTFVPLEGGVTGREDIDLVVPQGARERVAAWGSVVASLLLYDFDPRKGHHVTLHRASTRVLFYQLKGQTRVNFALPKGVSYGSAEELVQIRSVQDAAVYSMRLSTVKLVGQLLQLSC